MIEAYDLHESLKRIEIVLASIAGSLAELASHTRPESPNYRYQFEDYSGFDWSSIGADVLESDDYGPSRVRWSGHGNWTRRYAPARAGRPSSIWFSRASAAEEGDGVKWFTLATFRDLAAAEALDPADVKPGNGTNGNGDSASATPKGVSGLKYGDGSAVPDNPKTIKVYEAYEAAYNQAPRDADMLRAWNAKNK